jgi:hypothetical protein
MGAHAFMAVIVHHSVVLAKQISALRPPPLLLRLSLVYFYGRAAYSLHFPNRLQAKILT